MKLFYLICLTLISLTSADIDRNSASSALNQFAFKFLELINNGIPPDANIVLSPYTIWTALSIVAEGARGNTATELEQALGIPFDREHRDIFKSQQRNIVQSLARTQDGVQLEILNTIFTKLDAKLKEEFKKNTQDIYKVIIEAVNFTDIREATKYINRKLSEATHGRVPQAVTEDVVQDAKMVVASVLYFKGLWDKKFDKLETRPGQFYNEDQAAVAIVNMMHNSGNFPYARILNDKATAVELPYKGDRMSMIVMLPNRGTSLHEVITEQAKTPLSETINVLVRARETFLDATVAVTLPKFTFSSNLMLTDVLQGMGIHDAFGERANLTGIAEGQLYISRVTHKAQIEVDEEGTVGTAVTLVEIMDRIQAPFFNVNKPFAFFIVDKATHTALLMGLVRNPK